MSKYNFEKFASNKLRIENRLELKEILQKKLSELEESYVFEEFKKKGIPYSKINSMKDLFGDYHNESQTEHNNQLKALGIVKETETQHFGKLKYVRNPITYEKIELKDIESPPLYGEHTKDILKNVLNYKDDEIDNYYMNRIIF